MAKVSIVASGMPVDRGPGPGGDEGDQKESGCHAWSFHRNYESAAHDAEVGNRRIAEIPRPVGLAEKGPWAKLKGGKSIPARLRDLLKGKF